MMLLFRHAEPLNHLPSRVRQALFSVIGVQRIFMERELFRGIVGSLGSRTPYFAPSFKMLSLIPP